MNAMTVRLVGCFAAFAVTGLVFPGSITLWGALFAALWLTLIFALIRPLLQAVLLPLNFVLVGVLTPLSDALLVWWAGAWAFGGVTLGYGQALFAAVLTLLFYLPYSRWKRNRLLGSR